MEVNGRQKCCTSCRLIGHKPESSALQARILGMGALPAAADRAPAAARSMGVSHQEATHPRMNGTVRREKEENTSAAEGKEIDWHGWVGIAIELQPTILRKLHRPVPNPTACPTCAADIGQPMEGESLPWPDGLV